MMMENQMTPETDASPEGEPETSKRRTVAVFGAGIAGLAAAHELIRRGFRVQVYEANAEVGGFFRSARLPENNRTPSEYSWHGMGPWYHNVFDLMRQIPFDKDGEESIYDRALSRPIDFGIFPNKGKAQFYDRRLFSIPDMFEMTRGDLVKWSWLMLKTWTAHRRTERHYATLNAAAAWKRILRARSYTTWRSCFGPWIGSDWTRVSLHTAGQFFRKQLITRPAHPHRADADGPAWMHGAGDGWLLLRGPSSEFWFDRWVRYLTDNGMTLSCNAPLAKLHYDGSVIVAAELDGGISVQADHYVVATDPFAAAEIFGRSPDLEQAAGLRLFRPLIQDGPHTQVSFRIAFAEPVRFPRARTAVVLADSEFNLTLFAQEQVWPPEVDLGENVKSLWTGTSCVSTVPGRTHHLPVMFCSKEQFLEEVYEQIMRCGSLDALIREANGGRSLRSFPVLKMEVWHEWRFGPEGIASPYPKWVTTTHTQRFQPDQITPIQNLFLAGAHTRTAADVWSIEGAVESGRRAARGIDPSVQVIAQYQPRWLTLTGLVDDICYRIGAPHVMDLLLGAVVIGIVATALAAVW